jgi:predicted RNase H-like HicB family nuclease
MSSRMIVVRAAWDDAASVWVATSEDVPGLVTEADTFEALNAKLPAMISELLALDGSGSDLPEIPVHVIAERTSRLINPRAA